MTIMKEALAQLDARCGEISDQRAATAYGTFRRLLEVLDVRETELIDQLDQMIQGKLKGLAVQRDLAQLCSCLHFMRERLRIGNEGDVLKMKTNTVRQVNELTTPFQQGILEPSMPACQNYGQVFAAGLLDPSKCHVAGKVAVVGEKCTAILQAINFGGELCKESIKCNCVSEITGIGASCSVERSGQSQYEISYQPNIKGRHQLHIKVQGQHIRGSPFSVAVKAMFHHKIKNILILF